MERLGAYSTKNTGKKASGKNRIILARPSLKNTSTELIAKSTALINNIKLKAYCSTKGRRAIILARLIAIATPL